MGDEASAGVTTDGKLRMLRVGAIRSRVDPGLETGRLEALGPGRRLDEIERQKGPQAGLRYLAWALPEREAVWWACMCVSCLPEASEAEARVITAARAWVRRPEASGRATMLALARDAGAAGAAGHVGRAAFRARPEDRDSLRAGLSAAAAVTGSIMALAEATRSDAARRFRVSALDISGGGAGWIDGARRG